MVCVHLCASLCVFSFQKNLLPPRQGKRNCLRPHSSVGPKHLLSGACWRKDRAGQPQGACCNKPTESSLSLVNV